MKKLFGTDGIRAAAGEYPLDDATVSILGNSLAELLLNKGLEPKVLIGRDTRESGGWIEEALARGLEEVGGQAVSAGVIPTSAVSFLTKKHRFAAGAVISASHNPYQDNGIKIFSSDGLKISDEWEAELEKAIFKSRVVAGKPGIRVASDLSLVEDYVSFLKDRAAFGSSAPPLKIVLDCSNGAASTIAPRVFSELGFEVIALHNVPDGRNINRACGSLHPEGLTKKVLETKADIGVAYDGDADRAVWVDEKGRVLNGDHTLFVQSGFLRERGRLNSEVVVATTMSNMGLETALNKMGLRLVRTKVGDKYVLEEMRRLQANLGGEQSGHTIFLDRLPTGDGILTSLKMVEVMAARQVPLSELIAGFTEFPQILANVHVKQKVDFKKFPEIIRIMEEIREELGDIGRLDVRYSGTEPLARVMVEGKDGDEIRHFARRMTEVISKHLGI